MAKGIIYVMTTVVPGLIKIGKTGISNFEQRMYNLERNGYSNVVGLKRHFAIAVEDYDEKEILLDDIFSKSRLENTELFALDVNLVIQLLSSFEGEQIYPKDASKDDVFDEATSVRNIELIPDGTYTLKRTMKSGATVTGTMIKEKNEFILKKGSVLSDQTGWLTKGWKDVRESAKVDDKNVLLEDIVCNSPSMASSMIIGRSSNGWTNWKTRNGKPIGSFL